MAARTSIGRWRRRFALAVALTVAVSGVGVATGYAYLHSKWAGANDVHLDLAEGTKANFLIIGSDTREFVDTEEDRDSFGDVGGQRADTIMVIRVDPRSGKALLVSFPRDLWVERPGGGSTKINATFLDGPQGVVDAITHNFDIPIHQYVEVDFAGFRNIVDAMGGVEMQFEAPVRDAKTGLDIREAGCVSLDGAMALAFVRSRQFQYFESGQWRSDPSGDFGRIRRQQDFLRIVVAQAIESAATNPVRGNRLVDRSLENLTIDSGLGISQVMKLVRVFRSADPDDMEMLSIPAVVGRRAGQSVVLATSEAEAVFERLRGEVELDLDVAPSTVVVRVLNGVGTAGLATQTLGELQAAGFQPGGLADADRFGYEQTEIRHRPGKRAEAELVREFLHGVGQIVEDSGVSGVDVVLVVGGDFRGVLVPGSDESEEGALGVPLFLGDAELISSVWAQTGTTAEPTGISPTARC